MSRFHQLLIDVGNLDFIDANSAELTLVRTSSADSFSKVPIQKHQIESLPGSVKILPNDPGSVYELRLFKGKKSVASGFFVMPGYDHALVAQDLRTAWPIQFDQSFDLESRLSDKADTLALESEVQSREMSDSDLQDQIDAIYTPGGGNAALQNATYENGVLHWTGGEILAGSGVLGSGIVVAGIHAVNLTIPSNDCMIAVYAGTEEDFSEVGSIVPHGVMILDSQLYFCIESSVAGNHPISAGDSITVEMSDTTVSAIINGVRHDATLVSTPLPSNIKTHAGIFVAPGGSIVPDLHIEFVGNIATGLLPDETAARIAGDAALADAIDDVQTLAEVNQLNITTKADQSDLETLQTTVTGQGITLAQKANQTALDALGTVVSGKATPADITAAIAALVDGAPDALNTLAELATALAGEQAQIADLLTALALRVRVDAVQSLTLAQQLQARQNINAEAVGVAAGLVAAITPASIGAATAVQGAKADTALQSGDVAPVALSGQYSALTGLPTIPGLSSATPEAPTTGGTAGAATTAARGDHAHPLPTSAQITAAVLTGLASGSAVAIVAADTLLQALEKLQAQASANATGVAANSALLAPVSRKIGSSWYTSGRWYDLGYPYGFSVTTQSVPGGAVRYFSYSPLETVTLQNIATNITGAMTAGGTMKFGIYANNNGFPAARIYASSAIAGDTTGVKTAACTQTLTAGTVYWFGLFVSATAVFSANVLARTYGGVGAFGIGGLTRSGVSDIPTSGAGAAFTNAGYTPFLSFQVQ